MAKDKDYKKLIHTVRWLHLRRDKLSAHPLCEMCYEQGRLTPATEVHHIIPVENGLTLTEKERLMYDPTNLRALCHGCHVRVHTEMGRCGKPQAVNRAKEHIKRFKEKFLK